MGRKVSRPDQADSLANTSQALRMRAEGMLLEKAALSPEKPKAISPEETQQTLHELLVHQIELEMQNEELRQVQAELDAARARYFDLYDLAPVGYCTISEEGLIMEANLAATNLLGVARGGLIKQPISRFILKEDQDICYLHRNQLFKTREPLEWELRMAKIDGTAFWAHLATNIVQDADGAPAYRIVLSDITKRKQAEEALESSEQELIYLSYHDQLTGLYNRRFYEEELKRLDTKRNLPMTIVMGDVNGLKLVNDSFGHTVGDELLKKIAEVIKKGCRADDIIARLGGDEFVVILPKTNGMEAEKFIKRIKNIASKEKAGLLDISISIGWGTKTNEEENIQEVFNTTEDYMYKHKVYESASARSKTIDLIMNTLYEKSSREMLHSKRVSKICEDLATKMNFDNDDVKKIGMAGLMHDIGKIGIGDQILEKSGKLNDDERTEMQRHPEIGYRILSSVNEFSEIAEYVLEHQEYWNGKGYPRGLKGEEISIQARIIAVADAFDAMTSGRSYRKAFSEEEAMNELRRHSGTQFEPVIASILIEMVSDTK